MNSTPAAIIIRKFIRTRREMNEYLSSSSVEPNKYIRVIVTSRLSLLVELNYAFAAV